MRIKGGAIFPLSTGITKWNIALVLQYLWLDPGTPFPKKSLKKFEKVEKVLINF